MHTLAQHKKGTLSPTLIAQLSDGVALKPIYDRVGIERIYVSTYQAVSGSGKSGIEELATQTAKLLNAQEIESRVYGKQIAFNAVPH